MLDEWAAHGQPTCSVLGLLKTVPGLCKLDQKTSMCWVPDTGVPVGTIGLNQIQTELNHLQEYP